MSATSIEVLDILSDAGLLEIYDAGRYTIHQTIIDYARSSLGDDNPSQRFPPSICAFEEPEILLILVVELSTAVSLARCSASF